MYNDPMLTFLLNRLVGDGLDPALARERTGTVAGIYGMVLNMALSAGKMAIGLLANSLSVLADGLNNLTDVISNLIVIFGFKLASRHEDREHPFGHGRIEYISAFLISLMIMVVGIEVGRDAIARIVSPEEVDVSWPSLAVLAMGIAVKLYMAVYNRKIGRRINSAAMEAACADSISDVVSTGCILASALVSIVFHVNIDAWVALGVSSFILYSGYQAVRQASNRLIGESLDGEKVKVVAQCVAERPAILGIHDLIIHEYGPNKSFVSFHAEVDASSDILELHDMIDNLEEEIQHRLGCVTVIHMDPLQVDNPKVEETKQALLSVMGAWKKGLRIHDFRMVFGPSHSNLIFDVTAPFDFDMPDEDLISFISALARAIDPTYRCVIKVEHSFTESLMMEMSGESADSGNTGEPGKPESQETNVDVSDSDRGHHTGCGKC